MKVSYLDTIIESICLHKVGNKIADEGVKLSKKHLIVQDNIKNILLKYFINSFHFNELFTFYHDYDLSLNEVYYYCSKIFATKECMHEQSINLAKHLYNNSTHPKIKMGEFYVVYFKDCVIDEQFVDAIGLFKSENKDTFLKIYPKDDNFEIESETGININRLDKGCIIFNTQKENGYIVAVIDNTNKGTEAQYWINDFLHVRQRKDNFNQTQNMLSLCKSFVSQLPSENGKVEKATYMNRSVEALKEESVNINAFAEQVFETPKLVSEFKQYKETYQRERDIEIDDTQIALNSENLLVTMQGKDGFAFSGEGEIGVVLDTQITKELKEEGYVREVLSKVQNMRKDKGFEVLDRINLYISGNEMLEEVIKQNEELIKNDTLALEILYNEERKDYTETNINGEKLNIDVEVVK